LAFYFLNSRKDLVNAPVAHALAGNETSEQTLTLGLEFARGSWIYAYTKRRGSAGEL
jgi:hypothetical protein